VPIAADPYKYLASDIPANTCSSYPQESGGKQTTWSGPITLPATTIICGDLQLTGDVTLTTASPGSVLVIENGQLDTISGCKKGCTLQTAAGSALTIIFSGTDASCKSINCTHGPTSTNGNKGGTLDIQAPTTGTWKGVAIYEDPALTFGVNISDAGNSPTWDITGLVYLPHATVTFSGAVNKSSNGASCFVLVVDNITINGTADILPKGACVAAGLSMPTDTVGTIGLVK
jgi:hypothetical protein